MLTVVLLFGGLPAFIFNKLTDLFYSSQCKDRKHLHIA